MLTGDGRFLVTFAGAGAAGSSSDAAYRACEQITRTQARNFSYGIRLLPPAKRGALSAVYAFARRVDDIGDTPERSEAKDGAGDVAGKLARLAAARADLRRVGSPTGDPVVAALGDAVRRFPLPLQAFDELIDGVEMDVRGQRYADFDALTGYCRRVAGSIGRLSVGVFGAREPATADRLADTLGVALQQTNILRDIREDLSAGRCYLPADELASYGVTVGADGTIGPPEHLATYVGFAAGRAARWYDDGLALLGLLDRRSAACTAAMAGIYRRLLERIAADPAAALARRMSLPTREKAVVAAHSLVGVR